MNVEQAPCSIIRNLETREFELVLHKPLLIGYNYLMPHYSLKTGKIEFDLMVGKKNGSLANPCYRR